VAGIVEGETERGTLALEEGSDFRASPVDLAATGWFAIYGALQGTDPGEVQAYRISGAFSQGEHHPF